MEAWQLGLMDVGVEEINEAPRNRKKRAETLGNETSRAVVKPLDDIRFRRDEEKGELKRTCVASEE